MSGAGGTSREGGRGLRAIAQILGFVIGLGLLGYCVHVAVKPQNQQQLAKLLAAPAHEKLALIGLSMVVVLISGSVFHAALRPVRRLRWLDVQAINVIACLLALLPMKLSLVFRVLVHNRRDGVPVLTIGAWFVAISAVMGAVVGPILLVTMWRQTPDGFWLAGCAAGVCAAAGAMLACARALRNERVWARVAGFWVRLPMPSMLKSAALLERGHEGVRMLGDARSVWMGVGLRTLDICVQAGRFKIAAAIVDQPLTWDQAVLAGSTFFLIGALAPTGQVGAREAGTAGFLGVVLSGMDFDALAIIVLMISATETAVLLVGSMIGLAYLRPDRLLRGSAGREGRLASEAAEPVSVVRGSNDEP